jgi:DNA-binding NarL/FixJ family response regulator
MVRVAVLDDHPAVPAGLQRLVQSTGDLEAVSVADGDIVSRTPAPEQRVARAGDPHVIGATRRRRRRRRDQASGDG